MKRLMLSLCLIGLFCQSAEAGLFRCHRTGVCYNAVVAHHVNDRVVVVNNLIGIPVPTAYTQPLATQGATGYGYPSQAAPSGVATLSESYSNSTDMGVLWNQAARLTDQAQQLAGSAATDFHALVQSEGNNRAEYAKILAQGQAAAQALGAARPQVTAPQTITRSFSFKVSQGADGNYGIEKINGGTSSFDLMSGVTPSAISPKAVNTNALSATIQGKCVECHNSTRAEGNLNFLANITFAQQEKVLKRIITTDLTKRMPKGKPPLDASELKLFFRSMGE